MNYKIVTAAVFRKERTILLMRRALGEILASKWEFPGGKLEVGETPETCLKRELKEELDIQAEIGQHICDSLYNYSTGSILLKAYFVDQYSGNIQLQVHDKMQWIDYTELLTFELAPADIEVAQKIKEVMSCV